MTHEAKLRAQAADRYLRQYREAELAARSCRRQLVRLRGMARSLPSPSLDASPVISGRVSDLVGNAAAAIADASADLHRRITAAMRVRREIQTVIGRLPEARERVLLECRYIEGMSFQQIAEELEFYSAANARRAVWRVLARVEIA